MNKEVRFFVTESIRYARSLPYVDALKYLSGLIIACGDIEEIADAREIVHMMEHNDQQLELIASGQLRFGLDADSLRPRRKGPR